MLISPLKLLSVATLAAAAFMASAGAPAYAQRAAMSQCSSRVISQMAQRRAQESQVGSAVLSRCDRQLRGAVAEAIRSGQAPCASVDACIDMARSRAYGEAIQMYRARYQR